MMSREAQKQPSLRKRHLDWWRLWKQKDQIAREGARDTRVREHTFAEDL